MNFLKIYNSLVEQAKSEFRVKGGEYYLEKHHILPKCLGGDNSNGNVVLLTGREHFVCHRLLTRIYPNSKQIAFAYIAMCNTRNRGQVGRYVPTSREYAGAKQHYGILMTGRAVSEETRSRLKGPKTLEHRNNLSKALKGNANRKGAVMSTESRDRLIKSRIKLIYQYTVEGILVNEFNSIKSAGETLNISRGNISAVTDTPRKAGGFLWKSRKN
jgi:hypothetical protein